MKMINRLCYISVIALLGCEKNTSNENIAPASEAVVNVAAEPVLSAKPKTMGANASGAPSAQYFAREKLTTKTGAAEERTKSPLTPGSKPYDTMPRDITAERPSSTVPNPIKPPKEIVQATPIPIDVRRGFGVCGDEALVVGERPTLTSNFHYDFESGEQGWTVEGTFVVDAATEQALAGNGPEISPVPEGSVSYYVQDVAHFNNLASNTVYSDFVSPSLAGEGQSWRNRTRFRYQMQKPSNPMYEGVGWDRPFWREFFSQVRVVVEKCDGAIEHYWQKDNSGEPVLCELNTIATGCESVITLPQEQVRSIKEIRVRTYRSVWLTYDLGRVVLLDFLAE